MDARPLAATASLLLLLLAGCSAPPPADGDADGLPDAREETLGTDPRVPDTDGDGVADGDEVDRGTDPLEGSVAPVGTFVSYTLPAVYPGDGLYEPTIDVGADGAIYVSAHSQDVGRNPAPAYYSLDDGVTWHSMALFLDVQGEPDEQMSAPLLSDELFIVAGDDGMAWGADCCVTGHFPLVGWCGNGARVCHYNQNAYDHGQSVVQSGACAPSTTTDRPWVAYANGKLLLVNNPGGGHGGPLQLAAMDVPPATPVAYSGAAWGIEWNMCGSDGGHVPGIPDMRPDHFFAAPQPNAALDAYHLVVGNAADIMAVRQVPVFTNTHVPPAEWDSTPSQYVQGGQVSFDGDGALYFAAMNNTNATAGPGVGGIHFATSADDAASFVETTLRFDQPVSGFFMDGNRRGPGVLLNWGVVDGDRTDWYMGHVVREPDGRVRLANVMLAVDDGPEASVHVQGAALGPDGRAYMVTSENSANIASTVSPGDRPLKVVVQTQGPTMPA